MHADGCSHTDGSLAHLVVDTLNLVKQALGPQHLCVILLKVDSLVVQRLQVVLLVLLTPYLVKASLSFSPLFLFHLQPAG